MPAVGIPHILCSLIVHHFLNDQIPSFVERLDIHYIATRTIRAYQPGFCDPRIIYFFYFVVIKIFRRIIEIEIARVQINHRYK